MASRINYFRKKIMRAFTKNVGKSKYKNNAINKADVKRVLILRPNHRLGNLLLMTPLVQEVEKTFPNCKIDLFVKGNLGPIIFENYNSIGSFIKLPKKHFEELFQYLKGWLQLKTYRYDLVLNVVEHSSSGRLSAKFSRSDFKFYGVEESDSKPDFTDYKHSAKYPVYNFRYYLDKIGVEVENRAIPNLDLKLSEDEIADGKQKLDAIKTKEAKTICLFTHATGPKCYTEVWWADFLQQLKAEFQNYNIVEVLPVENISKLNFSEPSFYSKDVRELGSVIANADVFIGADSGIMHLSSAVHTPTIGLFQVTYPEVYAPYSNGSIGMDTNKVTIHEIIEAAKQILESKN